MLRKKSRFFYSILIPILLLGSVIVIGFSMYIYQSTYRSIKSHLVDERQKYLSQVKNNVEQQVKTVEYSFSTYGTTSSFNDLVNKPLSYTDYEDVKQVGRELSYISSMSIESTTYSLISLKQNWEISDGGGLHVLSATRRKHFSTLMNQSTSQLFWHKEATSDKIQMLVSLPFFSSERSAIGVAEIQMPAIKNLIDDYSNNAVGIVDGSNQILFQNHKFINHSLLAHIKSVRNSKKSSGDVKLSNGDTLLFAQSDYNNWFYVTRLSGQQVHVQVQTLAIGLIVVSLLILILLYFLAYFIAARSAASINLIRTRLKPDSDDERRSDDIAEILGSIDSLKVQNATLAHTVDVQIPELENLFVLNLFRDYVQPDDIVKRLNQFGYPDLSQKQFVVMLIQIDNYGSHTAAAEDLLLMAIENIVAQLIPENNRMRPVLVNRDTQATILFFDQSLQDMQRHVLDYANKIQQASSTYLKIKISIGISDFYNNLSQSKVSVDDAKEALHFRLSLGEESIIFYSEIAQKLNQSAVVKVPRRTQELLDAMRAGKKEVIQPLFTQIIEEIFSKNENPLAIKTSVLKVVGDIIQLGQLLGINFELSSDLRNVYYSVITIDNQTQLINFLYSNLVRPIVNQTVDRTNTDMQSLSDKIIHLIHTNVDQDISLDSIADDLHYNANYLSSVFKKEFGTNFSDYLQKYRIEIAKKWLVETEMTVKDIAARLQYNNPQNFIRFFKKHAGCTPGIYRQKNRAN